MENKSHHEPSKLSYQSLKKITNDFHEERFVGSGTFGKVYKGVDENGVEIAVKVLHNISGPDDKEFHKEFDNLRELEHPNIVKLVGFCNESEEELVVFEGKQVAAERLRMALCFEYVHNGSLQKCISDTNTGFYWHTRYKIIRGVCEGLKYLREGLKYPIMHFDLKPDNILLDDNMAPKIADFGLATLFGEENTKRTMNSVGTCGYWPPEYIKHQIISREFDIFSLGVIIVKIMAGHEGYTRIADMTTRKFVKQVHESWRKKLGQTLSNTSLELSCNQVKICIELGLDCLKSNRQERPTIQDIVSRLEETETMIDDREQEMEQFVKEVDGEPTLSSKSNGNTTTINCDPSPSVHVLGDRSYYSIIDPSVIPLSILREITDGFSQERVIGTGGYSKVYKGVLKNGRLIAVKKLHSGVLGGNKFSQQVDCLRKIHHENIVEFIGHCAERKRTMIPSAKRYIMSDMETRVLCFEYMPDRLYNHITDTSTGLDWHQRYIIIKGICKGLLCLHHNHVIHTDLKPSNILLDENMSPKIIDFGTKGGRTHRGMSDFHASLKYMAPEFIRHQVITTKGDIYSLGTIMVEIMVGEMKYFDIDLFVNETWRKRLLKIFKGRLLQGYCQQVKKCLELAFLCTEIDPTKRPDMEKVIHMLDETEFFSENLSLVHYKLLDVQPLNIFFLPFSLPSLEPRKKKKPMMSSCSCLLKLNNRGDDRVAFMLVANNPRRYLTKKPLCGVVPQRSSYNVILTTMPNKQSFSFNIDDFFTLYSVTLGRYDLSDVEKDHLVAEYENFFRTKEMSSGDEVQEVKLNVICDQPATESGGISSPEALCAEMIRQRTRPTVEIITTPDAQQVSSIDVHSTEPWIITTNHVGILRVWNFQTMTTMNSFEFSTYEPACVAKFLTREKWIFVGDDSGCIHVYNYAEQEHVESFDAHDSCITTLDVHSMHPFVLSSSSDDDNMIKLWDWDKGWKCTRTFQGHTGKVTQLKFNQNDADSFVSASFDGTIKIWSICSNENINITTLDGKVERMLCVDYFTRLDRLHMIVGCSTKIAQIWDLGITDGCVYELEGHVECITVVGLHPDLPVLITGSLDGTVRIWDSTTYKLENIIAFNLGVVYALGCIMDSRRIVVGCHQGLATMEISLP